MEHNVILCRAIKLLRSRPYTRDWIACDTCGCPVLPRRAVEDPTVCLSIRGALIAAAGSGKTAWPLIAMVFNPDVRHALEPLTHNDAIRLLKDALEDQRSLLLVTEQPVEEQVTL